MALHIDYEGEELYFDIDDIDLEQATLLKRQLNLSLLGLDEGLKNGDPDALRAVWYLIQVQSGKKNVNIHKINFKIVKFASAMQDAVERENKEIAERKAAEGESEDAPKE